MRWDNALWRVMQVHCVSLMSHEMRLHGADYCHGSRSKIFFKVIALNTHCARHPGPLEHVGRLRRGQSQKKEKEQTLVTSFPPSHSIITRLTCKLRYHNQRWHQKGCCCASWATLTVHGGVSGRLRPCVLVVSVIIKRKPGAGALQKPFCSNESHSLRTESGFW